MNTQSNKIVMLEWLLPLLDQQLSQVSDNWQHHSDLEANTTIQAYKQVAQVLLIADLPRLSLLASKLSQLAKVSKISHEQQERLERLGKFAHNLLKNELIFFVQTGSYRRLLIDSTLTELTQMLAPKESTLHDEKYITSQIVRIDNERYQRSGFDSVTVSFTQYIDLIIPRHKINPALKTSRYRQLLKAWQQQTQKLLADSLDDNNQVSTIQALIKVCRILWQAKPVVTAIDNKRLWFLTELWLSDLTSQPQSFTQIHPLLSRLEQVIQIAIEPSTLANQDELVERLATDIYLQLSLVTTDDSIQAKLDKLTRQADIGRHFLPYVLTELETIIFALDEPQAVVDPLQRLKGQLAQRGWLLYETQVDQILTDLTASMDSEDAFSQAQWQIERQLQELCSVIYDTEQAISSYLGRPVIYNADVIDRNRQNLDELADNELIDDSDKDSLKKLSQAFTDIKLNITDNIKSHPDVLKASTSTTTDLNAVLAEMGVLSLQQISDALDSLFAQIATHKIDSIGIELTQALAAIIAILERLLDYWAQQVLDQYLVQQAYHYIDQAQHLLMVRLAAPDDYLAADEWQAIEHTIDNAATAVVRYDDSGEVTDATTAKNTINKAMSHDGVITNSAANNDKSDQQQQKNESSESTALQLVRTQIKADNLQMNEAVRSLFMIEAMEVVSNLESLLPIWQQDLQDLTALTEMRSNFYALKVSAKVAGAFSISTLAATVEHLLSAVVNNTLIVTEDLITLVLHSKEQVTILMDDFSNAQQPSIDLAHTILKSNNLIAGLPLSQGISSAKTESNFSDDNDSIDNDRASKDSADDSVNSNINNADTKKVIKSDSITNNKRSLSLINSNSSIPVALKPFIKQVTPLPADSSDADPDIKEIFIEEAEEVLAHITMLNEKWQNAPNDLTKLKEIRLGFHTLKGSGRMVGANTSAELAWSIENLLNRVLESSILVSTDIQNLISDVLSAYPQLIAIFAEGKTDYPASVLLWIACATAYSQKQGADFSYLDIQAHAFANEHNDFKADKADKADKSHTYDDSSSDSDNIDPMLQTIYSVNEIMAEAAVIVAPQSEEEQALCEIFIEEAQSLVQEIDDFVQKYKHKRRVKVSDQIVRAFHTLRAASGSSALVAISEVSATIEHSLEQLQQQDIPMTPQHLQALTQSVSLIKGYLDSYDSSSTQQDSTVEETHSDEDLASLQAMLDESDELPVMIDSQLSAAQLLDLGIDGLLDAEWQLVSALKSETATPKTLDVNAKDESDHKLSNINDATPSIEHLQSVQTYIHQQRQQIARLAAKTLESPKFPPLLEALDSVYHHLYKYPSLAIDTAIQQILLNGHAQLVGLFDALAASMSPKIDQQVLESLLAITSQQPIIPQSSKDTYNVASKQASELHIEIIDTDVELLEIFLEEAQELNEAISDTLAIWRDDVENLATIKKLQRYTHTIKGGAQMAGIHSVSELTYQIVDIYERFIEDDISPTMQWTYVVQKLQDVLVLQIDQLLTAKQSFFALELIEQCRKFLQMGKLPHYVNLIVPAPEAQDNANLSKTEENSESTSAISINELIVESWPNEQPDADILELYLEEAEELISSSNKSLQLFLTNNHDTEALQSLQRDLHTIKGGARMVGANGIADLSHEMESVYEELARRRRPATKMASKLLTACHDWIVDAIFILKQRVNPPTPTALITALKQFNSNADSLNKIPNESLNNLRETILVAKTESKNHYIAIDVSEMPSMSGSFSEQVESVSTAEVIRIPSSSVEHMINLSGESAINRARIDMGITSLTNSIEEMGTTVQRLADQLRRMELELEVQILSQIDEKLIDSEDFDPLEMDQYSSLNQLSKSLSESASDLVDINNTLLEKTQDSESLLLQLARTQTQLQDSLMSSRIVPFTRLTPRLERIVRQTANELEKSVDLTIINADDEMDRTILERITSPLEHMLRNAVDHGIEDTQTRLKAGKDPSGHITLEVLREGSEVVIHLKDDGRGIDVEAVRKKAISKGLIDVDDNTLSDLDIMQYIFNAGLSTTDQLTQISGRGVGMDIVVSEIRQLGGVVSVSSESNKGSQFTIRVPLSVAITDALVVRVADGYYAIPLVQIERVVRINSEKLYDYFKSGAAMFPIDDQAYRVRYLNEILSGSKFSELIVNTNTSLPLIIIKSRTGQNSALLVDQISGSRIEMVVKPLGRQLSHITGMSAATIMGDGSVMLALDLAALMRNVSLSKAVKFTTKVNPADTKRRPTVMVVDDSVTVRKVTSRFLERQGVNVMVAKDGVDAIEILQETIPDLILLDIEMPRMDGFEVATHIRHSKRLQLIPIIMITSRTGEKHRTRAFNVGVDDYMGKPFQEIQLLEKINKLLDSEVRLDYDG